MIRRYNRHGADASIDESQKEFTPVEKHQLREHYPQQSAETLKAADLDQSVVQDVVRHHNVVSNNPSPLALMMRTPFIYAGIALSQNPLIGQLSIDNPSREFVRMYTERKLESNAWALVVQGPRDENIASSSVRMLTNRNGVQLLRPGAHYQLDKTPTRHRGLADHHHFAWTNFSPHMMWAQ